MAAERAIALEPREIEIDRHGEAHADRRGAGGAVLTGVDESGADELAGDPLAEELADAVNDGGAEVVEVQHVLAHEHHRALEPRMLVRPRQPVDDPAQHLY